MGLEATTKGITILDSHCQIEHEFTIHPQARTTSRIRQEIKDL